MATRVKFDVADLIAIAKMDAVMLREFQRAEREDLGLFRKFSTAMNKALVERQRELAAARKTALREIGQLMRKHSLTVDEVMA